jgi:hypothetical protein
MSAMLDETRKVWLWLLHRGGKWTAQELARHYGGDSMELFKRLHRMHRLKLVEQYPPAQGCRFKRYGVSGTCLVPTGMAVGEVQAC